MCLAPAAAECEYRRVCLRYPDGGASVCLSVCVCVFERSLQEGESAGELLLPPLAVSLISG